MGGVWRMHHEMGFPLELSKMLCADRGILIDWMEAMADASLDNNLPSLVGHMESILNAQEVMELKIRFMAMCKVYCLDFNRILQEKKKNAPPQ